MKITNRDIEYDVQISDAHRARDYQVIFTVMRGSRRVAYGSFDRHTDDLRYIESADAPVCHTIKEALKTMLAPHAQARQQVPPPVADVEIVKPIVPVAPIHVGHAKTQGRPKDARRPTRRAASRKDLET